MTNGRPPAPPRVANIEDFWSSPPPSTSERLGYWVARIHDGWRPNRRISGMGYYESAEYYGIYIWEYINVLYPMLSEREEAAAC